MALSSMSLAKSNARHSLFVYVKTENKLSIYEKMLFNSAYADWKTLSPESSQYSRSQARVKEEGCVRFWQTSIKNSHSNGFETHKKLVGGVTLLATHYIRTRVW